MSLAPRPPFGIMATQTSSSITTLPRTTLVYATTNEGLDIHIDVWAPSQNAGGYQEHERRPAFVYFHGGGLAVGAREVWVPEWLFNRLTSRGYVFISVDYRLVPPSTGHDILEDVKALWAFITAPGFAVSFEAGEDEQPRKLNIDSNAIAIGGSSAGGFLAYLAAMHCRNPKPAAIVEIYGLCGQIFSSYYLSPKTEPFKFSFKWLKNEDFQEYVYPYPLGRPPVVARSLPEYAGEDHPFSPEYPANPRMQLIWLYGQNGVALDYITGQHEPSFSNMLREKLGMEEARGTKVEDVVLADEVKQEAVVKELARKGEESRHLKTLFAQFNVDEEWPPVVFLHGKEDTGLPVLDSEHMYGLLRKCGIPTEIYVVEGEEHAFDYASDAEERWGGPGGEFEKVVEFVDQYTCRSRDT